MKNQREDFQINKPTTTIKIPNNIKIITTTKR
jgi:hypothetical protein